MIGVIPAIERWWAGAGRGRLVDAALGLGLGVFALVRAVMEAGNPPYGGVPAAVVSAALCGTVAVRRRWPVAAFAVAVAGGIASVPLEADETAVLAVLACAYTAGAATARRVVVAAGLIALAALMAGALLVFQLGMGEPNVPLISAAVVGLAVGDAVRSRRELVVAWRDRARRAEQALEEEARRRVMEERMRIAREVHDVVAHHIAVVNVQAGVSAHLIRDRPDAAAEALGHVRGAARRVLDELGTMLAVLRGTGDETEPVDPAPRLDDLDRLVASFATAGLEVDLDRKGTPRRLPAVADLAAYRIIQESLTNAQKHGRGAARVTLTYLPDALHVEVRNERAGEGASAGTGHGLTGMRERAAAIGGTLSAGPAAGGEFVVTSELPTTTP